MSWSWRCTPGEDYAMLRDDETGVPVIQTTHDVDPMSPVAKQLAAASDLTAALLAATELIGSILSGAPVNRAQVTKTQEANRAALRRAGRWP